MQPGCSARSVGSRMKAKSMAGSSGQVSTASRPFPSLGPSSPS
jgi:hypothetical protein